MRPQVKYLFSRSKYVTITKNAKTAVAFSLFFFTHKVYVFLIYIPTMFQLISIFGLEDTVGVIFRFPNNYRDQKRALRKKCPFLELFWSVFSRILAEYGEALCLSPYSVQMRENTDQKNSDTDTFHAV